MNERIIPFGALALIGIAVDTDGRVTDVALFSEPDLANLWQSQRRNGCDPVVIVSARVDVPRPMNAWADA